MLRICRTCEVEYKGAPGSTLCPACVKAQKSTTIRTRICRTCGKIFPGGPRAWYCPDCRRERQLKQGREAYHRAKARKTRKIGSTDACVICGESYTVTSGLQKYCPACAPEAIRGADRAAGRAWAAQNAPPEERKALRDAHTAELTCKICGTPFKPHDASQTCSPECSAKLAKQNTAAWEKAHREERNQYHREQGHQRQRTPQMSRICRICGKPFALNSGCQIYCTDCIPRNPADPSEDPVVADIQYLWSCGLSIHTIAKTLHISDQKARRTLIEFGMYTTPKIKRAQQLRAEGKTIDEIAAELGCGRKNVIAMLPYDKGMYNLEQPTENAARLRHWEKNKEDPNDE